MDSPAWGPGEPSNGGFYKNEHCADLLASTGYQWNDEECSGRSIWSGTPMKPICQIKIQVQGDCRDYTLDDCSTAPGPFVTNRGDVKNEEDCQFDCDKTYDGQNGEPKCQFYVWDYKSDTCGLYNYTMADYINSCNVMAGSPLPGLKFCDDSNDECMVSTLRCTVVRPAI